MSKSRPPIRPEVTNVESEREHGQGHQQVAYVGLHRGALRRARSHNARRHPARAPSIPPPENEMTRLLALFVGALLASTLALAAPAKTGRVEANGVNYYYEIHGTGSPLLLLHGGLGSIDMFGPLLPTT